MCISAINAPAKNNGSVIVNGTTKSFTASLNLSAYQKKILTTQSFSVGHITHMKAKSLKEI